MTHRMYKVNFSILVALMLGFVIYSQIRYKQTHNFQREPKPVADTIIPRYNPPTIIRDTSQLQILVDTGVKKGSQEETFLDPMYYDQLDY